ncbi:Sex determination protein tasselseed-2 [Triticum urartu]|uniref:Sex determination protein tasselseed-2 n=1 Tax=Triticum urartu TaxID=4572 RepID=M7YNY7_TRIUA|nr:Sex determination protein tasselseed-2 [Triticum urartu]
MPALDVMPEKAHQPAMSPSHHGHGWDASGAPTPMHKRLDGKTAACELGAHGIRVNCVSPFGVATPMLINAWRQGHDASAADDADADIGLDVAAPSDQEVEKMEEVVRSLATLKGSTLRPRDIAEAVLFLASDDSRYVSGHNLVVDGGVTTSRNLIGL